MRVVTVATRTQTKTKRGEHLARRQQAPRGGLLRACVIMKEVRCAYKRHRTTPARSWTARDFKLTVNTLINKTLYTRTARFINYSNE